MSARNRFGEAVVKRTRKIVRDAEARASAPEAPKTTVGSTAPDWLKKFIKYLPEGTRQTLRHALGPDPRVEQGRKLITAARRQMMDIRTREAAIEADRRDLFIQEKRLDDGRLEMKAKERKLERMMAEASRAVVEASGEKRVRLADIECNLADSPRPIRGVARLAANIKRFGQLTPLVCQSNDEGQLILITGFRRMAALRKAGMTHGIVRIVEGLDDAGMAAVYVAENCFVQGLSPNAVRELAALVGERPGFREIIEWVEADDEETVEEMFLDEMVSETLKHLQEGASWLATIRPHWSELASQECEALTDWMTYFARVAKRLTNS